MRKAFEIVTGLLIAYGAIGLLLLILTGGRVNILPGPLVDSRQRVGAAGVLERLSRRIRRPTSPEPGEGLLAHLPGRDALVG